MCPAPDLSPFTEDCICITHEAMEGFSEILRLTHEIYNLLLERQRPAFYKTVGGLILGTMGGLLISGTIIYFLLIREETFVLHTHHSLFPPAGALPTIGDEGYASLEDEGGGDDFGFND